MDDELIHEGVKGMKWGVRHGPPYPIEEKPSSRSIKKERKQMLKNRRQLSDEEIQESIRRLESEKRLKDLSEADLYPGKKAVTQTLADIGKQTITKIAVPAAAVVAVYAIGSALSGKKISKAGAGEVVLKTLGGKKK